MSQQNDRKLLELAATAAGWMPNNSLAWCDNAGQLSVQQQDWQFFKPLLTPKPERVELKSNLERIMTNIFKCGRCGGQSRRTAREARNC